MVVHRDRVMRGRAAILQPCLPERVCERARVRNEAPTPEAQLKGQSIRVTVTRLVIRANFTRIENERRSVRPGPTGVARDVEIPETRMAPLTASTKPVDESEERRGDPERRVIQQGIPPVRMHEPRKSSKHTASGSLCTVTDSVLPFAFVVPANLREAQKGLYQQSLVHRAPFIVNPILEELIFQTPAKQLSARLTPPGRNRTVETEPRPTHRNGVLKQVVSPDVVFDLIRERGHLSDKARHDFRYSRLLEIWVFLKPFDPLANTDRERVGLPPRATGIRVLSDP